MTVDQLNRRLGDALGRVRSGTMPRFCWKWAPDLPYWSTRLGNVWVLCQWQRPGMSEAEWHSHFGGRFAYPRNGMYHAHEEAALPYRVFPTEALTDRYIRALDRQMSTSLIQQLCDVNQQLADDKERAYVEWVEKVQDSNPAFSNFAPGTRGGHVSYGGV